MSFAVCHARPHEQAARGGLGQAGHVGPCAFVKSTVCLSSNVGGGCTDLYWGNMQGICSGGSVLGEAGSTCWELCCGAARRRIEAGEPLYASSAFALTNVHLSCVTAQQQ